MSKLVDLAIQQALQKNWIGQSEVNSIRQVISRISQNHNISPDTIIAMVMMEAGGLNPRARKLKLFEHEDNCFGVVQVCEFGTVAENLVKKKTGRDTTTKEERLIEARNFINFTVAEQLDIWEKLHLNHWVNAAKRGPRTLAELYIINLFPGAFLARADERLGLDDPIKTVAPNQWGTQAKHLYEDPNATREVNGNDVTFNSAQKGLIRQTKIVLEGLFPNEDIDSIVNSALGGNSISSPNTIPNLPGDISGASAISGVPIAGLASTVITAFRNKCETILETQGDAIIYTGCEIIINSAKQTGIMGSGATAPGMSILQKGIEGSFNLENIAVSAAKGSFIFPMPKGTSYLYSSGYGWRWGRMHHGIDLAPTGYKENKAPEVLAVASGKVVSKGWGDVAGFNVKIEHQDGGRTRYLHMLKDVRVEEGQEVQQGQVLGRVGSTGRSTGPHLHFEYAPPGSGASDPAPYLPNLIPLKSIGNVK